MSESVLPTGAGRLDRLYGWSLLGVTAVLCCLLLAGCGADVPRSAPVDAETARDLLNTVMESWKNGETPEELQEQEPAIVVQDMDWAGGMTLVGYEVQGDGEEVDANLIAKVKLKLKDKGGSESEKLATYVVGTSPKLTVFRDALQ